MSKRKDKTYRPMFFNRQKMSPQEARELAEKGDTVPQVQEPAATAEVDYQDLVGKLDLSGVIESPLEDMVEELKGIRQELINLNKILSSSS